ncbi:MAG: FliM/FliN family flagellar motor switch protein [Anaeromyxobacter sp.]
MLFLDLPRLSRGFAALAPEARRLGDEAAAGAGAALGALLGCEVGVRGRATPGPGGPLLGAARLPLALQAVPAAGALEVEAALVAAVADRLAGGDGAVAGATALTPVEGSLLELLALTALDGACRVPQLEAALGPRLARTGPSPASPLCIELELAAGPLRGRGRLLLEAGAVRALAGAPPLPGGSLALPVSYRQGRAELLPEELEALFPGDVVLLEAERGEVLVLPGGARASGFLDEEGFHVDETGRTSRTAQLPVVLEVELARVELTLSELSALAPGGVVPLAVDRRGRVTLRAGERAVAQGELVEIEGALGVRITALEVGP